jgi:uncharacterized phosphosugar-binding protein
MLNTGVSTCAPEKSGFDEFAAFTQPNGWTKNEGMAAMAIASSAIEEVFSSGHSLLCARDITLRSGSLFLTDVA